ncbi:hypothetical protein P153DRAFT_395604 [Dothidotthia symphoricarpi CBS 119687]|uniref:Uncharacterized protein n=1 Tax=Dothidotthia symphoricarpi CBS 119687 TaxID=1392245 RepID=A0A6A6AJ17_9PLEO|nr:uncharacterized protein P153DRAFT_395604 [Dothidotthia symphoricarpi CBS 119687]KAF2131223.1 hypothetical protein P153DRAFT_395604 [Dothidotthia symphoricarpi CBS 119687]
MSPIPECIYPPFEVEIEGNAEWFVEEEASLVPIPDSPVPTLPASPVVEKADRDVDVDTRPIPVQDTPMEAEAEAEPHIPDYEDENGDVYTHSNADEEWDTPFPAPPLPLTPPSPLCIELIAIQIQDTPPTVQTKYEDTTPFSPPPTSSLLSVPSWSTSDSASPPPSPTHLAVDCTPTLPPTVAFCSAMSTPTLTVGVKKPVGGKIAALIGKMGLQ